MNQNVRIGHRIHKEVSDPNSIKKAVKIIAQPIETAAMQSSRSGRPKHSKNTRRSSSFPVSKQPLRNSTAKMSRAKCPLDQQNHYSGKCLQLPDKIAEQRRIHSARILYARVTPPKTAPQNFSFDIALQWQTP